MGVLDDAIREHLELKRRHGAAEEEIARKEAEALGPARRGPAADPDDDDAAAVDAPAPTAADIAEPHDAPAPPPEPVPPAADEGEGPGGSSMADAAAALGESTSPEPDVPVAHTEPLPAGEEPDAPPVEPTIDVPAEVEPPGPIEPADEPVEAAHPPVHDIDRDPLEPPAPMPSEGTVEFDTLGHREEDELEPEPGSDEDVLEETPEFLRETPEHDRLWFEQKPPRDFDLDD